MTLHAITEQKNRYFTLPGTETDSLQFVQNT